jgi:anti-sigma factor RsiW
VSHLSENDIAGYLDADLSGEELLRVEQHLDACADCRAELVSVARLLQDRQPARSGSELPADRLHDPAAGRPAREPRAGDRAGVEGPAAAPPPRRRAWLRPAGAAGLLAAAALAALILVDGDGSPAGEPARPDQQRFGEETLAVLQTHAPADGSVVSRDELRFTWADHGTASYRISLTREDGGLAWTQTVADTSVVLPPEVELPPGRTLFWYVDAIGTGIVARTGVKSFVVAP